MRKIEKVRKGANDRPEKDVTIVKSGTLPVEEPFPVDK